MDKQYLNDLLDSIYELEGLVHLALIREDSFKTFQRLICNKGKQISSICEKLESSDLENNNKDKEEKSEDKKEPVFLGLIEEYSLEPDSEPEGPDDDVSSQVSVDIVDIDNETLTPVEETIAIINEDKDQESEDLKDDKINVLEEATITGNDFSITDSDALLQIEDSTTDEQYTFEERENDKETEEKENESVPVEKREIFSDETKRGKLVFSINDRFRFKRSLFGNSDADFNTALTIVASMENFEEAEAYFLEELGMEAENREVVDFLEIIRNYFS